MEHPPSEHPFFFFVGQDPLGGGCGLSLLCYALVLFVGSSQNSFQKLLTCVSNRVAGVHGKRSLGRGWQKRLVKGWRRVGFQWVLGGYNPSGYSRIWRDFDGFGRTLSDLAGLCRMWTGVWVGTSWISGRTLCKKTLG